MVIHTRPKSVRFRIWFARRVGPVFWPAWYVAPKWKRDRWSEIAS